MSHASEDYEKIRENLYQMLQEAMDALDLAKEILKSSEHPRAVETYSGLLKNVTTLNSQILELSKIHKDITERKSYKDGGSSDSDTGRPQIQNVYMGDFAHLQKILKKKREEDLIDVTPSE